MSIKIPFFSFLLLVILSLPFHGIAQGFNKYNDDSATFIIKNKARINHQYLNSYLLDTRDIFISPMQWNKKQWMTFGGLSLSFSLLLNFDDDIRKLVQDNRTTAMDNFSTNYLEPWGSGKYSLSSMALLYLSGSAFKNERLKKVALLGTKTYLVSGFLVLFPKYFLGRKRPNQGANPYSWNGFGFRAKSFVSGHTTSIWSIATVVASEYNEIPLVPIISYSIATLTGFSRINDDEHWLTDVIGAAFFGYAMGKLIYNKNNWKFKIEPYATGSNFGLYFSYPLSEKEY